MHQLAQVQTGYGARGEWAEQMPKMQGKLLPGCEDLLPDLQEQRDLRKPSNLQQLIRQDRHGLNRQEIRSELPSLQARLIMIFLIII